jgi:hypothetical protein
MEICYLIDGESMKKKTIKKVMHLVPQIIVFYWDFKIKRLKGLEPLYYGKIGLEKKNYYNTRGHYYNTLETNRVKDETLVMTILSHVRLDELSIKDMANEFEKQVC